MSQIIVSSGTTTVSTVDTSNTYLVEGSGTLVILNGGLVSNLIAVGQVGSAGGTLIVSSGGTVLNTLINNAVELVYGAASGTTIFVNGTQYVESGGIASGTTISANSVQTGWRTAPRSPPTAARRSQTAGLRAAQRSMAACRTSGLVGPRSVRR
jgi:autotransporter passenger strand-loop-strand repeat protein